MEENRTVEIYESEDGQVHIDVQIIENNVWINRIQMSELFGRDIKTIGKHIKNALSEELAGEATVANFATVQIEGNRQVKRSIEYYNLDMILSVGYRVKSSRGAAFRKWSNHTLKQYLLSGVAINQKRIEQLQTVVQIMKRSQPLLETDQVLAVIDQYSKAMNLLTPVIITVCQNPKEIQRCIV